MQDLCIPFDSRIPSLASDLLFVRWHPSQQIPRFYVGYMNVYNAFVYHSV